MPGSRPFRGKSGLNFNTRGRGSSGRSRGRGTFKSGNQAGSSAVSCTADGFVLDQAGDREGTDQQEKWNHAVQNHELDERLGFGRFEEGTPRVGWLINIQPTLIQDAAPTHQVSEQTTSQPAAAVELYFIQEDGGMFRATMKYQPYFYIASRAGNESEVEEWLQKRFEGQVVKLERIFKEDLQLPNHLTGYRRQFIKLYFRNVAFLLRVRRELLLLATKNRAKMDALDTYAEVVQGECDDLDPLDMEDMEYAQEDAFVDVDGGSRQKRLTTSKSHAAPAAATDPADWIIDIREYDVPYYLRVAIDKDLRVGLWYTVTATHEEILCARIPERVERAEPVVMAYDIETSKPPLKFPDPATDQIMMISYMIDGQGFLITNREIVGDDIADFDYSPKPEYEGPFTIFNEASESALIRRWFEHIQEARPTVMATYNGDSFDFPFVAARASAHGIDMFKEIGFRQDSEGEFKSRCCIHMDCFRWVKRDSYLPQGSQGLKAVTVAKLGYNPIELDPELMTPYAVEQPQILAQYSVSDAVATYYLYMKYVHPFIFSLCNIIPLNPDEVLRKGSGTLCETLLMVEAYIGGIIMPNRHVHSHGTMYEGHLLESETYVGGHVEALEAGVFRSDIPSDFKLVPRRCQQLIDDLDSALTFSIVEEGQHSLEDVVNYEEVKSAIESGLETMRDQPSRQDNPLIYHLDVAAMYPNIMLSNRLQPDSVVDEATCAACDFNRPGKTCDRRMTWAWRGEYFPTKLDEYKMVRNALESESFPPKWPSQPPRKFSDLAPAEQTSLIHKRLGDYSRKVYKKTHETKIVEKEAIICQRENPFYIDTVRAFRDRRYTYKGLHKQWKKTADVAQQEGRSVGEIAEAKKMIVIYDSLQLAHKCILNSFYGYVMRKGARWHSMEMAGITCLTGAKIIQMAREIIEEVGRPLELDTDGIWCMLPGIFPENFDFKLANGKTYRISYPCSMLNHLVHQKFTNHQYHQFNPESKRYEVRDENSIFFELDGPYKAMILPSSKEEDKLLKKRYAVFNDDGSLAELKGFEVKRRGELQLIKVFQTAIFEKFLKGTTLKECYDAVAEVANRWLDVLATKAVTLHDEELIELISENRSMSRTLAEYGAQKSTSIRTAKRLSEFLGEQMVKDKGLSCRFIISAKPFGSPVTDRAVPVAIFSAEPSIQQHYLRKWLKDNSLVDLSLRSILDWSYYTERLGSVIQKLITIPAAMQKVSNPVPRIHHPDWLARRLATREDTFKQHKITDMFARQKPIPQDVLDALLASKAEKKTIPEKDTDVPKHPPLKRPSISVDYSGWVAAMKPIWKEQRMARKADKALNRNHVTGLPSTTGDITSLMLKQTRRLVSSVMEIVQILPNTHKPGEFRMWTLVQDVLHPIKITVLREFYINLKRYPSLNFFPKSCIVESVVKALPRSQTRMYLYKVSVPEIAFADDASEYLRMFTAPEVEGTYELQVPLLQRGLIHLGNTCSLSPTSKIPIAHGFDQGFNLADLSRYGSTLSGRRYLDSGKVLRYCIIYHFYCGSRHAMGIFFPESHGRIYLTDRSASPQISNMQRYYESASQTRAEEIKSNPGVFQYMSDMRIETSNVATESLALKALNRDLSSLKGKQIGSNCVVMIHSDKDYAYYDEGITSIVKFPVLMVHSNKTDNKFETFGWQRYAGERMVQHFLRASSFIHERILQAEQFDVPMCNFENDAASFVMDLEFSKKLTHSDHLLWWSSSPKPDLGGRENDINAQQVLETLSSPEISVMGAYSNASIELSIADLAIDAVLQSSWAYDGEKGEHAMGFQNASHNLDDYSKGSASSLNPLGDSDLAAQTFSLFRSMVKVWMAEGLKSDGHHYRGLIRHFWRWISSPSSKMFDPALYRFVHGLMKKVFSQLLTEFRRLGTKVIYADFSRIFLLTSKATPSNAYAYSCYIVTAVNSRDLFKFLELDIVRFWDQLLWVDVANFAGIICNHPGAPVDGANDGLEHVDMHWNMVNFLPPAIQQDFLHVICVFIHDINQCKTHASLEDFQSQPTTSADKKDIEAELLRPMIKQKLTRQLMKLVTSITDRQSDAVIRAETRPTFEFPRLPGSYLTMTKPALEFVKMICFIMELAKSVAPEIRTMKRILLDLIGIREFASEATFKNPCVPFAIPVTICKHCNAMRSFDLCRDPDLLASVLSQSVGHMSEWHCSHCGHEYNKLAIEAAIIEQLGNQLSMFQLQDVRCSKCSQIKADDMSLRCACSGEYGLSGNGGALSHRGTMQQIAKRLRVARVVAETYAMETLLELTTWMLSQL
ncbi:hypothetical protein CROQUDRAFT_111607 [Cronartium quercuum f. sp. fusiforme G11]|uniref:DNA polymerase epsilon catalytic subunit n=1 Tax=Cronartium quercuum f. sp. fusiforme G11 TaxID=708437 RepID=A0A9P6N5U4_9BASI|nr:hypothetical protein CROQUDRAFT_111607 [Cronartium quercuum f. sp. fusiforme G11]